MLTALAIVLGVTFVTGTLILGDTLNSTFNNLIGTAYQHVSFEIRGKAVLNESGAAAVQGTADRKPVPESIATAVSRVPGVAFVHGSVQGYAQFLDRNGNAIGGGGGSTLGFSFDPNQQLSPYRLVEGKAPTTADDVVMDKATAAKHHFSVGDRVLMNLPNRPQTFTITGIVTFGGDNNLAGVTLAGFDLQAAQSIFNSRGYYDTINVLAAPGADNIKLAARDREAAAAGRGGRQRPDRRQRAVERGRQRARVHLDRAVDLRGDRAVRRRASRSSTRSRSRSASEPASSRCCASSARAARQVFRSVLGEAALTGLVASLIGLGLGVLAALGLKALLKAFGIELPSAPLVFEARTVVVAIAVGVGVTVISAILPARRAVRIAPVAALVEDGGDGGETVRRRRVTGGVAVAACSASSRWWRGWPSRRSRSSASARCWCSSRSPCSCRSSLGRCRARSDARWPHSSARRESSGGRTRCATRGGLHRPPRR